MKTINVAITSIGSGVGQSIIDSCRLSSLPLKTFGYGINPFAFGSYSCDEQRILLGIYADNYLDELLRICEQDHINILIPGLDDELLLFADNIARFQSIGVAVPVSSRSLIELCRDKELMSDVLNAYGDCFVKSYSKSQLKLLAAQDMVNYPLIAKPLSGFASRGLLIVMDASDIDRVKDNDVVQEIAAPSKTDSNHNVFMKALQRREVAQVSELSLQVVIGKNGNELGRYASYNRLHNGIPIEIIPADVPEVWAVVERFLPVLHEYGIYGPLNIQGRITDSGPKFFEMNARFTGITGLRAMSGFNEVEAIIADAFELCSSRKQMRQNYRKIGLRQVVSKVIDISHTEALTDACQAADVINENNLKRKVMVTGANSYLGRAVVDALRLNPQVDEIFAVVRDPQRFDGIVEPKLPSDVTIVALEALYNGCFQPGMVDVICHIASARPVNTNEEIAASLRLTQFMSSLASLHQVPGFINLSSQSVYGTKREPLWSENTPVAPETAYAQAKWASELMVENIKRSNPHCAVSSLRLGRLVGPSTVMRWDELPHKYMRSALNGETLSVWGGEQKLDFIDVRDAAELISQICLHPYHKWEPVLNVAAGRPVSVLELAERCLEIAQSIGVTSAALEVKEVFKAPSFGMSIDKLGSVNGWSPKYDLSETLYSVAEHISYEVQK
ncbi:MAG: NAD-dependent epimerase/dehydratase family protein [Methylophaga sp.]|nr:NAD-dependent epimerase/dehydratase family protein [Methylophaga sp.]